VFGNFGQQVGVKKILLVVCSMDSIAHHHAEAGFVLGSEGA